MNAFYWFVLGMLGVWRVTHLLSAEDGPWDVFVSLRKWAGETLFGKLLDCFYCLSLWVAAPFAWQLAQGWRHGVLLWLALSGAAIILERATGQSQRLPVAPYVEDPKEIKNGMLQ
jgi:hypothetical protein